MKPESELCTPTGAALLTHFADGFGPRPLMRTDRTGVGLGTKDLPKANILRVFSGEKVSPEEIIERSDQTRGLASGAGDGEVSPGDCIETKKPAMDSLLEGGATDRICELSANIDDMTGEELGFAMEQLLEAGALDVYHTPIIMKKSRPAVKFSVLCRPEDVDRVVEDFFKYTKTAGIRRQDFTRYILDREVHEENGIRIKTYRGYGVKRSKAEYDDLARQARETGKPLWETE